MEVKVDELGLRSAENGGKLLYISLFDVLDALESLKQLVARAWANALDVVKL